MKYILIIAICFLGLTATSQVQKQGRSNFPTVVDSSLAIGKNFILPVFRSFSQLSTYTALDSSGRLVFIRDSNAVFYRTNAHTWAKLSTGSGSGSVAWGSITGTLSNQTDLQTVLDSKVDSVILRGGDSLYNHYSTGEVQFIGVVSGGGSTGDTLFVVPPLYAFGANLDSLRGSWADTDSSGFLRSSDWNYFAVKPDSTVLNATGDTLLSYLGSTVIYSHAIAGGGGTNIGNSDLSIPPGVNRVLNLQNDATFSVSTTTSSNDVELKIDPFTGNLTYPVVNGVFTVDKVNTQVTVNGDVKTDSLKVGTTDKIGFPLYVVGDGTNTAAFMNGNVGIGTITPTAKLHIASTDTFALVVTGMGNSVVGTDSAVVRDIDGNFKVAAKSSTDTSSISNRINLKANIASPTFTGTVTIPTPFTLGATSVTSTGTQLNYLNAATGTTGTTSTNLVYSTSPTLVTPTLGAASGTSLVIGGTLGSSSLLDVQSTTKGVLIPRMTTTQRDAISSAGSQLLITNTTTNNLDKYNGTEWEPVSAALTDAVLAMNGGGSPFIAETVGMNSPLSILGSTALGSGGPGYCAIYINKRVTLTGAAFFMATQGNFTGNNVNSIGLYSYSGGTITKIAETANDPNIWKNTSSTWVQVPFSSTVAVSAGIYFLAVSYSSSAQTTAPALGRGATMLAAQVNSPNTTNSFKFYSYRTGQTSLPSTESMSNLTAWANPFYLAVY